MSYQAVGNHADETPVDEAYDYDDDPENVKKYGKLYTWDAVMNDAPSSNENPSGVQGVCPSG